MPREPVTHYNPPTTTGKTRCGRKLRDGGWTDDTKDVTCDTCLRCIRADRGMGA